MSIYNADLHIHSVLSPCSSLDMSPVNIVDMALKKGLKIISVTDHNTLKHCKVTSEIAQKHGIFFIPGVEITTIEEVHCLAYFPTIFDAEKFDKLLENSINKISINNQNIDIQLIVNENEEILGQVDYWLLAATKFTINELEKVVHNHNGLFVPAHVDRQAFGVIAQLGFMPPDLKIDAIEAISPTELLQKKFPEFSKHKILHSSDAHYINDIGERFTPLSMEKFDFEHFALALK